MANANLILLQAMNSLSVLVQYSEDNKFKTINLSVVDVLLVQCPTAQLKCVAFCSSLSDQIVVINFFT